MNTRRWILAALALFASTAHAFIDPPVITPEHPTTETPIEVSIRNGVCDALLNHTVTLVNGAVELRIRKITTQQDPLCINPISTAVYPLPFLSAGQHALSIYLQDNEPPSSLPVLWFQTTLNVANAGGAPPAPVPSFAGPVCLGLLVLGLSLLAARYRNCVPTILR